jgi:hypothetical protein
VLSLIGESGARLLPTPANTETFNNLSFPRAAALSVRISRMPSCSPAPKTSSQSAEIHRRCLSSFRA